MFEAFTFDNLMARMLDRVPDDMDKREGSMIWDALAPAALELELGYIGLDYILMQGFADTAEREYLIRRCMERGLTPYAATRAVLKGVFLPTAVDVTGKRFSLNRLNYVAVRRVDNEPGAWEVECETPGVEGGQYLGSLIPIEYIDGLESATATSVLIPGEEEEDTEALRQRYFANFRNKAYGGNKQDYIEKTNAIDGVGATKVTPVWQGPGTVELTILDSSFNPATSVLIQRVQDTIDPKQDGKGDGVAPIGHIVTVDTAKEIKVDVGFYLELDTGYEWMNVKPEIEKAISDYLTELRKDWENKDNTVVRVAQIETRLLKLSGVVDVGETTINGQRVNLALQPLEIPVLGVVSND